MVQLILIAILSLWMSSSGWAAIARIQAAGTTHDGAANFTHATVSTVTAGSMIVISAARWKAGDANPYVAGDCTKSAGTATIGTVQLERSAGVSSGGAQAYGVWTALVTGSGTLTMQVSHNATAYGSLAVAEYSGTWDGTRTEATNGTANGSGSPADSGNATSAGEAVFIGSLVTTEGSASAITQDAAFSLLYEDEDGSNRVQHSFIERIVASGTTDSASWATTGAFFSAGVAVLKEGAGGGGGGGFGPSSLLLGVGR